MASWSWNTPTRSLMTGRPSPMAGSPCKRKVIPASSGTSRSRLSTEAKQNLARKRRPLGRLLFFIFRAFHASLSRVDNLTKEERSIQMSKVRGKNTKPEMAVRSMLHRAGYRYGLHRKDLPGKPDIVMPKTNCRFQRIPDFMWVQW